MHARGVHALAIDAEANTHYAIAVARMAAGDLLEPVDERQSVKRDAPRNALPPYSSRQP